MSVLHNLKRIAALAVLLVLATTQARAGTIEFRALGEGRGLDARVISSLLVDREGFLWAASREGLHRYDGYRTLRFNAGDPPYALTDSDLRALYESSDGLLWVATNNGGLDVFDRATGRFRNYRYRSDVPDSLSNDSIYGITEAGDGRLWVCTQIGLNLFDPASGRAERFLHDPADPGSLSNNYTFAVLRSRSGVVWVTTIGGGVSRWNPASRNFERHDLAAALGDPGYNDVFPVVEGRDGTLWFGTRAGLVRMDPRDGSVRAVPVQARSTTEPYVTGIAEDEHGRIWALLLNDGLFVHDPATGSTRAANEAPPGSAGQLPAVAYISLAVDADRVFVGTWGSGIFMGRMDLPQAVLLDRDAASGADFGNTMALQVVAQGTELLAGTLGSQLKRMSIATDHAPPRVLDSVDTGNGVVSLARTADGTTWAGTTNRLLQLSPTLAVLSRQQHERHRSGTLGAGFVTAIVPDDTGLLWVGTGGSGLYSYHPSERRFTRYAHDPADPQSPSGDYVTALFKDSAGRLWVGTRSQGLNVCRTQPLRCRRFAHVADDPRSLSHFHVSGVHEDRDGRIWVTTAGGLDRAEFGTDGEVTGFVRLTRRDGLVSDATMAVLQDDDGSLWISTREGLSRFDPASGRIHNWVEATGLPVAAFNRSAAARSGSQLFFGTTRGLLVLPAGTPFPARRPARVSLTTLERLTAEGPVRLAAGRVGKVAIDHGDVLSVGFAVLDFAEAPHEYEYRMQATDQWTPLGDRQQITFLGLAPGRHTVSVRARDVFGLWNEAQPLTIEVVPPLWMTTGFRLLVLLALLSLLLAAHWTRMVSLKRRNRELQALQAQREAALERAQQSQARLEEAYAGLRGLTARLESAKEEERQLLSRELHDGLGQLLTAAKLNLQLARRDGGGEDTLRRIDESVAMIDRTITQARDISRLLRPPLLDEAGLVPALEAHLGELSRHLGMPIEVEAAADLACDQPETRTTVFRVVQEAVNNALRHAGATRVQVKLAARAGAIEVCVTDDGRGFDPQATAERVRRGEHLGLLGMSERVRGAGGEFTIEARPGEGSTVRARIPA